MKTKLPETEWRKLDVTPPPEPVTVMDFCRDAIDRSDVLTDDADQTVRLVIQAIIDRTSSPYTVQELTRILREGGVEVPEVTFD